MLEEGSLLIYTVKLPSRFIVHRINQNYSNRKTNLMIFKCFDGNIHLSYISSYIFELQYLKL